MRPENPSDYPAITEINNLAFRQPAEGKLVENLRKNPKFVPELSIVVEADGKNSWVFFFPIKIKSAEGKEKYTISLAPIAVKPEFQKQGIGDELIREGLKACLRLGYDSVIVLGHPDYYPKFGFEPTVKWGIKDPFGQPDEAFMALELKKGALEGTSGIVEYPDEFREV